MGFSSIKIGIDGRALAGNRTGVGRYTYHLCQELDKVLPDAQFIVYSQQPIDMPVISDRWILRVDTFPLARHMKPVLWLKVRCGRMCREDNLDIFWAAATFIPSLAPEVKTISTIYDFNHLITPETMSAAHKWSHRLFLETDIKRADAVIAISQGTTSRLRELMGRQAELVVHPAVDEHFKPQSNEVVRDCLRRYGVEPPYLLAVGTWEPRKNLAMLVETFLAMRSSGLLPECKLVLIGGRGWKDKRLVSAVADGLKQNVLPLGYVPDADLPALYAGADVFVFPSIYEGFGIPVLEARACGTRVVTTDLPELREAGGSDAVYIDSNRDDLREGILRALAQPMPPAVTDLLSWNSGAKLMAGLIDSSGYAEPVNRQHPQRR